MKDYIYAKQGVIGEREFFDLSVQVSYNAIKANELQSDLVDV
jgi:hypothetical protein